MFSWEVESRIGGKASSESENHFFKEIYAQRLDEGFHMKDAILNSSWKAILNNFWRFCDNINPKVSPKYYSYKCTESKQFNISSKYQVQ